MHTITLSGSCLRPLGNLGEASSQLSWGENLRMVSQNTFTQIEPFPFVACNRWGSGCPTSLAWMIAGNNLGAFRVIYPENKYRQLKPALYRAMPIRRSYPKIGHMKGLLWFLIFYPYSCMVYRHVYTDLFLSSLHFCIHAYPYRSYS